MEIGKLFNQLLCHDQLDSIIALGEIKAAESLVLHTCRCISTIVVIDVAVIMRKVTAAWITGINSAVRLVQRSSSLLEAIRNAAHGFVRVGYVGDGQRVIILGIAVIYCSSLQVSIGYAR